ncbi:hypothetical protein SCMU_16680 [Sinomonas cyclohexanicum]|uniref:Uncharacterized protein n=1 Tax=Sinomonas cyclohexanicum TaxID=322009 RepID=A0ABN6FIE3_SINCY|nr:hypothetical protein SCMU_16680 [Corynebacterium cyclohexanicum]
MDGVVRPAHELVQADPLDKVRAGIDEGDVHIVAPGEAVGRHRAGVPPSEHDHPDLDGAGLGAGRGGAGVLSHGAS